ncbi:MAG TPA: FGGY-family carbohydrate kinase, partial [Roseiarcus sp.]|nr:FGGY-family carbohydrate kinase [Roseiarcus sp.]
RGRLLASARRPIAIWREAGEIVEQSSEDIWRATTAAIRQAVKDAALRPEAFVGISFDATCSLAVLDPSGASLPVGPSGKPERDVIVWMDHRAVGEADYINRGGYDVLRYVGGKISPEMEPPKLLWLAKNMPDTYRRAGHFFDLTDFLTWRASDSTARSICTITCKWTYLAHERRWAREFFESIGLSALADRDFARIGADIVAPGAAMGNGLTAKAATEMGLPPGIKVGAGLIDAHAGAVGTLGAAYDQSRPDPQRRLALILGTSSCCMAVSDVPLFIDGVWGPYYSALTPGQWLTEGGQSAFGAAIDRLMNGHPAFAELSRRSGEKAFEEMENEIVARAGSLSRAALIAKDLHVLPDFIGNRSPYADPNARAVVVGLDLRADHASLVELYVAALAGLADGVGQIIGTLEGGGYDFDMLVVSGGAGRSRLVRQMIADATQKKVGAPETSEPVLLGAAMLAAVAAGRGDMPSVMSTMSRLSEEVAPQGGEIAAFHARKRAAFDLMQQAERRIRELAKP